MPKALLKRFQLLFVLVHLFVGALEYIRNKIVVLRIVFGHSGSYDYTLAFLLVLNNLAAQFVHNLVPG